MARGNRDGHRRFGLVRKLPSGRFQASYLGPDGRRRTAPETFGRKTDADRWLSTVETELLREEWTDPQLAKIPLREFSERWLVEHKMSRRTREEYASVWRLHLAPYLADMQLGQITTERVRTWRSTLLAHGRSEDRAAKAYRLLRAILNTAVDDGLIKRNPCRIKGAGQHRTPERPTATVAQVYRLAELVPARFHVLILAAAFTGLRWGELIALRRCDLDFAGRAVRVYRRLAEHRDGEMEAGPTKSVAGARTVSLPDVLVVDCGSTWPSSLRTVPRAWCSSASGAARSGGATSTAAPRGRRPLWRPGSPRVPLPRPTAHRQPPRRRCRCQHPGADAPDGPRVDARCAYLPARHERAGPRPGRPPRRPRAGHDR